jgi:NAD(P)-dependent dehydrogenase (short-subunit alcohol dehydrogenase family)
MVAGAPSGSCEQEIAMPLHPAIAAGQVAVVTGAASGIGLAAARRFAEAGMRVVMADIDAPALEAAAAGLGERAVAVVTDVGRRDAVQRLKTQAEALGPVSLLMNNAAREGAGGLFDDAETWRRTLDTNLWGAIHGVQQFAPEMMAADWPCAIVNTGSKQGITLPPGDTAYNVSKAALKALTESLAHALLATGDRVTAHLLIPGFTFTGLTRARGVTEKPAGAWTADQVVDFLLPAMARGDFYILCPDNDVTREMDEKRMQWGLDDILHNRPALSRWRPDYADAFADFMKR